MKKIIVYNPDGIIRSDGYRFHGYITEFVKRYANYIFVPNPLKAIKMFKAIKCLKCGRKIKIVSSLIGLRDKNNILVGFGADRKYTYGMENFKGKKIFHLMDYYINVQNVKTFLKKIDADYVIGHCQMDKECEFFKKYYSEYIGKVINLPFGYEDRFKCLRDFDKREKIAVGLGSINLIADKRLSEEATKEMREFFKGRKYQHLVRAYIRDHADEFLDVIDAKFPSDKQQKDYSYDAVEMLNNYQMFVNDEGFSNFPPARTYEGIACGCVMVAPISTIYESIGFIPDYNYIGYVKGDYQDLHDKIASYINNQEKLRWIQRNSLKLARKFNHEKIADLLYKSILERIHDKN